MSLCHIGLHIVTMLGGCLTTITVTCRHMSLVHFSTVTCCLEVAFKNLWLGLFCSYFT